MESDAGALVRRPALKTGFSEMGWGSTPPLSAKLYPISEMNITPCYERGSGGLIPSLGAKVRKMGRTVMQQIANLSSS